MKRLLGLFFVLVSLFSLNFYPVAAGVDDFVIKIFEADYYLSRDAEGQSVLKTIEKITAEFPNFNQNHGIERALPLSYDGHSTSLEIVSIKNEISTNISYTTYESNGNLVLRIGDADTYVYGEQTYVITYNQSSVTKFFSDTNDDEFYWDVNGTGWSQNLEKVTAIINLAPDLVDNISIGEACYYGEFGSKNKCDIVFEDGVYTASVKNLSPGENMTIVAAFKPETFSGYKHSLVQYLQKYLFIVCFFVQLICLVLVLIIRVTKIKPKRGKGIIVPEYLPPKDADIFTVSTLVKNSGNWLAAAYVDMAVRHKIKILEIKDSSIFTKNNYKIELLSTDGLSKNEYGFLQAVFIPNPVIGETFLINPRDPNYEFGRRLVKMRSEIARKTNNDGYYMDVNAPKREAYKITFISFAIGIFSIVFGNPDVTIFYPLSVAFCVSAPLIGMLIVAFTHPLSDKGNQLVDYISGLKMYIKIAENDRIKYLQSVAGAERINLNDGSSMIKLYEKVLPYAILFGLEKTWNKVIGNYYTEYNAQPEWYSGASAFNAAAFTSSMSHFYSSSRFEPSQSSSSGFGGSGGGGSSGGGGGGGGGGGW